MKGKGKGKGKKICVCFDAKGRRKKIKEMKKKIIN